MWYVNMGDLWPSPVSHFVTTFFPARLDLQILSWGMSYTSFHTRFKTTIMHSVGPFIFHTNLEIKLCRSKNERDTLRIGKKKHYYGYRCRYSAGTPNEDIYRMFIYLIKPELTLSDDHPTLKNNIIDHKKNIYIFFVETRNKFTQAAIWRT